ncbi:hypothetical protein ENU1_063000 [Entamoeba nuttalli P19]|uniref:Uncharacterized protein n=1 Tax=Entamoeba nuttalli (strain P19) TaxID=1076696 RepID=K2HER0_ENTNP|nr:hypothetical protein ENU1_063000 [Entamoeba nuttalli P19]EKE41244.1 hypothetical protein ENU1_063000 [Entamoeba nuttalli P19]|eukprot:XP_008856419.1 hypothetical protein ENU1_063000 [Entamoeba nuttalli P19]
MENMNILKKMYIYTQMFITKSYFDPDNELERTNKPDIINEYFSKTEESVFDDANYEEYNEEFGNIDYPNEEEQSKEKQKEIQDEEATTYKIINPINPEQIYTYDDNTIKILDGVIDINNDEVPVDTLIQVD